MHYKIVKTRPSLGSDPDRIFEHAPRPEPIVFEAADVSTGFALEYGSCPYFRWTIVAEGLGGSPDNTVKHYLPQTAIFGWRQGRWTGTAAGAVFEAGAISGGAEAVADSTRYFALFGIHFDLFSVYGTALGIGLTVRHDHDPAAFNVAGIPPDLVSATIYLDASYIPYKKNRTKR